MGKEQGQGGRTRDTYGYLGGSASARVLVAFGRILAGHTGLRRT